VSMPYDAARATVEDTQLCPLLNSRLTSLFTSMPASLDPSDVESLTVKWGLDSHSYGHGDVGNFVGKRSVVSFLSWFDYCDTLIMEAHKSCGDHIAQSIAHNFFHCALIGPIMQADEKASLTTTAILTKLLTMVRSKPLLREMIDFIIPPKENEENAKEQDDKRSEATISSGKLLLRLFERCDHISDEIAVITLRLFETLLSKSNQVPLERLVVDYLKDRGYHAKNPGNIVISEELEWDLEPGLEGQQASPRMQGHENIDTAKEDEAESPKMLIQRAVHSFLSVLPDSAKSSQVQDDDSGYDSYLREAHRSYKEICGLCKDFNWPELKTLKEDSPERCSAVSEFNEGPFLSMLFGKISRIMSQPYAVNLVVTSIASRLTLLPHPNTHELFADPLTSLRPKARSLFTVVQVLAEQVIQRIVHVNNFKSKLITARRKLTGMGDEENTSSRSKGGSMASSMTSDNHKTFLEGAIVLEEFCKELAAIAFVKHHSSTEEHQQTAVATTSPP